MQCAIRASRIIGPILPLETINSHRYIIRILQSFFGELTDEEKINSWFQQDSMMVPMTSESKAVLFEVFQDVIIIDNVWSACSPDLKPCNFYL